MSEQRRFSLLFVCALVCSLPAARCFTQSAANAQGNRSSYHLRIPVNEIGLTFHASDARGAPLTELTRSDASLLDDGKRQTQIVMFESLQNLPIRAGFLFDSSASMMKYLPENRSVIAMYASGLLRKGIDRGFVMQFGTMPLITQNCTGDAAAIAAGAARVGPKSYLFDPFTAIFDSLYTTCRDEFSEIRGKPTGNFICCSATARTMQAIYLREAVDMRQRTRTAIYAIVDGRKSRYSDGQRTLKELASETGGRVFFRGRVAPVWDDLRTIEEEQRNQYRLVYRPVDFKADGSFHRIKFDCVVKGARIVARSGYFAFARP